MNLAAVTPAVPMATLVGRLYDRQPDVPPQTRDGAKLLRAAGELALEPSRPGLEALRESGAIAGYELLWLTGELGVRVQASQVDAAKAALAAIDGLSGVEFEVASPINREE